MMKRQNDIRIIFFGVPDLAVYVLEELQQAGLLPEAVVTSPDKPRGRRLQLSPSPVKEWAQERGIRVLQPERMDASFAKEIEGIGCDVCVVVAFGKILPKRILDAPAHGTLNIHPSLLPRYRGASPVRSAILRGEREFGVSVMVLDEEMDHGPIVAQKRIEPEMLPPHALALEERLMREGGRMLAQALPSWIAGDIASHEQNHDIATYCEKIEKEDGLLDLSADPLENLRKIRAYEGWPGTYAYFARPGAGPVRAGAGKRIRVKILAAHLEGGALVIDTVKPEGKSEMSYGEFLRSGAVRA